MILLGLRNRYEWKNEKMTAEKIEAKKVETSSRMPFIYLKKRKKDIFTQNKLSHTLSAETWDNLWDKSTEIDISREKRGWIKIVFHFIHHFYVGKLYDGKAVKNVEIPKK